MRRIIVIIALLMTAPVAQAIEWHECKTYNMRMADCAKCDRGELERCSAEWMERRRQIQESARQAPTQPLSPTIITNCDAGGCWDNRGGRYNKGGGNIYFGPNGACQKLGTMMHCP